ncbi:hypothetical protein C8F04DRAFT_1146425 [Mycena alexandri]|uniref:Uncharacterized protein n=1 Tax=Mycena alexandri TaxID=1745969 RepID=A0AAD6S3F2_9AGAR|nr:hypothetical protein C8F04DRAFT_1146425 [Mycena alexandri]
MARSDSNALPLQKTPSSSIEVVVEPPPNKIESKKDASSVSTVSGHMTALGNGQARVNKDPSGAPLPASSSNDDILRGLVVDVGSGKKGPRMMLSAVEKDVKPVINHEAQYYDQYYASLENSAQAVEYLDSLKEYRKRSRSHEGANAANNIAKVENVATGFGNGFGTTPELVGDVMMEKAAPVDDPDVYGGFRLLPSSSMCGVSFLTRITVNGTPMPYSQVTEAEHDLMTPEEYVAFFQIMQEQM